MSGVDIFISEVVCDEQDKYKTSKSIIDNAERAKMTCVKANLMLCAIELLESLVVSKYINAYLCFALIVYATCSPILSFRACSVIVVYKPALTFLWNLTFSQKAGFENATKENTNRKKPIDVKDSKPNPIVMY